MKKISSLLVACRVAAVYFIGKRYSVFIILILLGCSSGKRAYNRGDYYAAVLKAVNRLRQNPTHKVSTDILRKSYQLAVNTVDEDVKNLLAANAPFKWKSVIEKYNLINVLYQEIRTSPAALAIVPKPINRFDEINKIKENAADESYQAGIEALMKPTREDAKKAYYLFQDASKLVERYKESVEMMEKAKDVATLRVTVEVYPYPRINFEPTIFNAYSDPFIKFYKKSEVKNEKIDHFLTLYPPVFSQDAPVISTQRLQYSDSVKVGEKKIGDKAVPIYEKVKASMSLYKKSVTSFAGMRLVIVTSGGQTLRDSKINCNLGWDERWAVCQGDTRAIPEKNRGYCGRKEPYMDPSYLHSKSDDELNMKLEGEIRNFYRQF